MNSDSTLSNYCEIIMGQSPAGDTCNKIGIGIPLLNGPSEFGESHPTPVQFTSDAKRKSNIGDLLFCVRGSTGRMNWSNREYAIGRGLAAIRAINNYPIVFVKAIIETKLPELLLKATGSVFSNVNKEMIAGISIRNISVNEAKSIGSTLKSIEDQISLLRKSNSTLEAIAQTLFKSWFVDFDPVRAKSAGKLPDGIDEATTALFPDSFEQSELGEIPKGWKISNIGSELTTILGGTPSRERPEFWNDGVVSWINSGKVNEFRITTASELITEEALLKSATKLLPARTTVIAITGATLGQVSIVEIEACTNQSVVGLIQNEKFSTEYIYFWINFNIKKLISSQTGGAQQHINKGNVEDLHLLVPNIKILNKFKSISQPLFLKVAENCFQINTLRNIRGTLLPRLISGQLGLPDLEEINNKTKVNA
jgi:type I restriction enzyme S subunit